MVLHCFGSIGIPLFFRNISRSSLVCILTSEEPRGSGTIRGRLTSTYLLLSVTVYFVLIDRFGIGLTIDKDKYLGFLISLLSNF